MKQFHVVLLFICFLSIAAPPPSFAKKDLNEYIVSKSTPGKVVYAISTPTSLSDNAALTITLSAYELAPYLASSPVAGSSGYITTTATVKLKTKITVVASTDSYCYKQVGNSNYIYKEAFKNQSTGSGLNKLHIDPGLITNLPIYII